MTTQQVLDKQGLQHYATKMCNAENRKVGSKSLPTALNDIDTAIDGFKTLFDNEYGTPVAATIENNSNSFTVGVGNGIDKSREVENSFTDIELSGNSMVNIYNGVREISSSVNRVNNFATITNIKPNTQYTIKYAVKSSNKLTSPSLTSFFRIQACDKNNNPINEWLFGVSHNVETSYTYHTAIFNTPSELSNIVLTIRNCYSEWNLQSNTSYIKDIIIIEGNYTNKPLPSYFEGLKSVGENEENKISISSFEKASLIPKEYFLNNKTTNFRGWSSFPETLDLKDVVVKFKVNRFLGNDTSIKIWAGNDELNGVLGKEVTMNCTTLTSIGFYNWNGIANGGGKEKIIEYLTTGALELIILPNINHGYPFYPYFNSNKKDKKEISLNEPLRSLGDVKDTIEKINGEWKIVRRCSEVVLNGSEPWILLSDTDKEKTIGFRIANFLPLSRYGDKYKMVVCDRFPSYKHNLWKKDYEGITTENNINNIINDTQLQIIISKSELSTKDVQGFKQWLSNNPTRVIYELETPIIEDIDPVVLQCWKDGNIFIDEVLPVESTHTVALNKPAQIQNNIEELTSLRNRVQKIEEQYNSTILTQAYQTILLNFDNDL